MSDSPVIAFMNKLADLILLNILWIICSLPVFTIGASTCAMFYVCIVSIRNGDGYVAKRFFKSFRENFKNATILWLVIVVLAIAIGLDLRFWYVSGTVFGKVMFVLSAIVAAVIIFAGSWIFPVLSKLEGTMLDTVKNSGKFAFGYLPYTLIVNAILAAFIWGNICSLTANAISLFIGFSLVAYIQSFFYYKVFMKHIDESYDDYFDIYEEK